MEVFILIAVIVLILIMWFSIKAEPADDGGDVEKADSDRNQQQKS